MTNPENEEAKVFTRAGLKTFHAWTYGSLEVLLRHLAKLPDELFSQEVDGFGFDTLQRQLLHVLECEAAWLQWLRGKGHPGFAETDYPTLASLTLLKQAVGADTVLYLETLNDAQLNAKVSVAFPDGSSELLTPAAVLHHVLTHTYHHKGQMVAMCRLLGQPAPDTDLLRS